KRHIVISTSGIVSKIIRYADEDHKYRLAISLNATTDKIRNQIMPLNKKWPLKELLQAVRYYTHKTGQRVTFEYALMAGINDSLEDAERLQKLVNGLRCKINLIPYNVTEGKYHRPSEEQIIQFYKKMAALRAPVTIRWSKGDDIAAACGQLAVRS
ncbi:MAG: 23S rRNA (adenine(2503)-C(2))-methyltransferase RlmN, partial [bacterium]